MTLCFFDTARTVCGANSCSHICAVVGGQDECFCPVGLELAQGSNTTCQGTMNIQCLIIILINLTKILMNANASVLVSKTAPILKDLFNVAVTMGFSS